jgi:hypothetical protein
MNDIQPIKVFDPQATYKVGEVVTMTFRAVDPITRECLEVPQIAVVSEVCNDGTVMFKPYGNAH